MIVYPTHLLRHNKYVSLHLFFPLLFIVVAVRIISFSLCMRRMTVFSPKRAVFIVVMCGLDEVNSEREHQKAWEAKGASYTYNHPVLGYTQTEACQATVSECVAYSSDLPLLAVMHCRED